MKSAQKVSELCDCGRAIPRSQSFRHVDCGSELGVSSLLQCVSREFNRKLRRDAIVLQHASLIPVCRPEYLWELPKLRGPVVNTSENAGVQISPQVSRNVRSAAVVQDT